MQYRTRDFGQIEINEKNRITFVQPPFGFEQHKHFALLYDEALENTIVWLQSLDDPDLCFILMHAVCFAPMYQPHIPEAAYASLGEEDAMVYLVCTLPENMEDATVNLKCPVLIGAHKGTQVLLSQNFPVRYPLAKGALALC